MNKKTEENKKFDVDFTSFLLGALFCFMFVSAGFLYAAISPQGSKIYHYEHYEVAKFRHSA